uniref:Uncharacterized protein n=1 Tax=Glossina palpalis gambiensis TaxID=67801 RepID=A0A1B0APD3_9MUSC
MFIGTYAKGMNVVHLVKSIIAAAMLLAYYILLCSGCTYEGVMLVFMLLVALLLLLGDFVDVIDDVSSGGGDGGRDSDSGGDGDGDGDSDGDVCIGGGEGDGGYYQLCTFTACCFAWWLVEQPYRLDIWLTGWSRDEWESFRTHIFLMETKAINRWHFHDLLDDNLMQNSRIYFLYVSL